MASNRTFPTLSQKPGWDIPEDNPDPIIRTTYENFMEQTRESVTRVPLKFPSLKWAMMSDADRASLMSFYNITTAHGALDFNWTHPYSGTVYVVKFDGVPKRKQVGPNRSEVEISLQEV